MWLMLQDEIERLDALIANTDISMVNREDVSAAEPVRVIPGGTAVIPIKGVLMPKRSAMLDFFGVEHTAYSDIIQQTEEAPKLGAKRIRYDGDSPGGDVTGMVLAMEAIRTSPLPTRFVSRGKVASAAYMLASQANRIDAENETDIWGSVGVAQKIPKSPFVQVVTNSDSPKKHPDLDTEEGVAMAREGLDDYFNVLAERIAEGRMTTADEVKQNFGQGGTFTARTALSRKMIDGILPRKKKPNPAMAAETQGAETMDLEQLKADHPETFKAAVEMGIKRERSRVNAHLIAAEAGDMKAAVEAIKAGEAYSQETEAKHQAFARKQRLQQDRTAENVDELDLGEDSGDDGVDAATKAQQEMKAGIEAAVPGMEWEVL